MTGLARAALPAKRRTQAERRESTRAALLDAAIAILVDEGYAGLTTRRVAERAGVSQGTQMHYFPTRGHFLAEAVRHVAIELSNELRSQVTAGGSRDERRRLGHALDRMWAVHNGPIFQAAMELWVAGRTDGEVRESMAEVAREVTMIVGEASRELFPHLTSRPGAGAVLDTAMASMRGLAMLRFHGDPGVDRRWRQMRAHLLVLYDGLLDEPSGAR